MKVTNATVENADVMPSAITAREKRRVSGPATAIQENRRLVAAMAMPANKSPRTTPKRPAKKPAAMEQGTITSHPNPLE